MTLKQIYLEAVVLGFCLGVIATSLVHAVRAATP
jgi:hypothetical protein